nr:hypothetical protein Iba_chr04aCG10610 [Ipomoea batatas]
MFSFLLQLQYIADALSLQYIASYYAIKLISHDSLSSTHLGVFFVVFPNLHRRKRNLRNEFQELEFREEAGPGILAVFGQVELEVKMWSDKELTGVYEQINTVVVYDEGHDTFYYWIILC